MAEMRPARKLQMSQPAPVETPRPKTTESDRDAITAVGTVRRYLDTDTFKQFPDPAVKKRLTDEMIGKYLDRALKPESARRFVQDVRSVAKFSWADVFGDMRDEKMIAALLFEVWPYLTIEEKDAIVTNIRSERPDVLRQLLDSKLSTPVDKKIVAEELLDIGYLRGNTEAARKAYIAVLCEQSPEVGVLFKAFDQVPKTELRKMMDEERISREDLELSMLGKNPDVISTFFVKKANKGRGKVAAAGAIIVAAEAGAARLLTQGIAAAAERAKDRGYRAEAAKLANQAAQFKITAEVDAKHLPDFHRRAGKTIVI